MQRIDGYYLYQVGTKLHPISNFEWGHEDNPTTTYGAAYRVLYEAHEVLKPLLAHTSYQFRTCRGVGEQLQDQLSRLADKARLAENEAKNMAFREVYDIQKALEDFEVILNAELAQMPLYVVTQKAGYDTSILISDGVRCFPADLGVKAPEAVADIAEATKCLAFELFTGAGFHFHRANESVLHRYWDAVSNGAPRPTGRNMGDYLRELDKNDWGNKRTLAALRDLKDLDRNPLIHPEYTVESLDAAIAIMNTVHGAITRMLGEMPAAVAP